jgi:hypothetical protein
MIPNGSLLGITREKNKNSIVVFTLDKALDKERFTGYGPTLSSTYVGPWPYFSKAHYLGIYSIVTPDL